MCASGLEEKPDKRKVNCFLNVAGARARDVFDSLQSNNEDDRWTLDAVLEKFSEHCIPKVNELLERERFRNRKQQTRESGTQFASVLRKFAETCNLGESEDSMIRDQLVFGMTPDEKR